MGTLEQFPKNVKRFSIKNCGKNKKLEQISDSIESHSALKNIPVIMAAIMALLAGLLASLVAVPVAAKPFPASFIVCHGYDCHYRTKVMLTAADSNAIMQTFAELGSSAEGERAAISRAVMIFEERSTAVIGVRDEARMAFGRARRKGQMDCVDESRNTDGLLRALQAAGLLKFHHVGKRASRGFLLDGRYPHWTAVIIDETRVKWAVDSWYEAGGGAPDIMELRLWKKRGVGGQR